MSGLQHSIKNMMNWIDARLPVTETYEKHMSKYYAPKNTNFWYLMGVLATVVLVNQLLTGIWLTMSYIPTAEGAFGSIEYIMRDVNFGWMLRYMHSTGASAFFLVVYLHMFRGLMYGSYQKPRELIWILGMLIFVALMAEGFLGYLLPWGNMSFWAGQVIVSLAGAVPIVGDGLATWVRGDFNISGITLNRFFALHVVLVPMLLLVLVFLHIVALHEVGSNNPDGIDIKKNLDDKGKPLDGIPFHPYLTLGHDLPAIVAFCFLFAVVMFYFPDGGGYLIEAPNYEMANPLKTPDLIAPVWYYTPFYSMLRAATFPFLGLDAKFWGLVVMGGAIVLPAVLPWLDRSKVKSIRYKGMASKSFLAIFVVAFFVLGYLGVQHPTPLKTFLAQICTAIYFAYFLLMPWYTSVERTKPVPERIPMQ
ncbi:MAG: cytochrome b [Gammaproteobacteria bacterium TMED180]|nr:MAG: cytochrome b [Gammaproteobacteria bacterium TMED180]|tara:strand:- start:377 stop:1636 length:1260 start_codon:yes stop_codon:yes gene_type:complete